MQLNSLPNRLALIDNPLFYRSINASIAQFNQSLLSVNTHLVPEARKISLIDRASRVTRNAIRDGHGL
jgi:hypothetical protein